jgi:hypothetical protein
MLTNFLDLRCFWAYGHRYVGLPIPLYVPIIIRLRRNNLFYLKKPIYYVQMTISEIREKKPCLKVYPFSSSLPLLQRFS